VGRSYLFQRNPLARKTEQVDLTEYGDTQMLTEREVRNPQTGEVIQRYLAAPPQAIDPDDNPTYLGDRLIPRGEEHEDADGRITQVMERLDDNGKTLGTYEFTWERTGERQTTMTRSRRIFS
jgi:hypothetical protein